VDEGNMEFKLIGRKEELTGSREGDIGPIQLGDQELATARNACRNS
jgi:hypothetical protein